MAFPMLPANRQASKDCHDRNALHADSAHPGPTIEGSFPTSMKLFDINKPRMSLPTISSCPSLEPVDFRGLDDLIPTQIKPDPDPGPVGILRPTPVRKTTLRIAIPLRPDPTEFFGSTYTLDSLHTPMSRGVCDDQVSPRSISGFGKELITPWNEKPDFMKPGDSPMEGQDIDRDAKGDYVASKEGRRKSKGSPYPLVKGLSSMSLTSSPSDNAPYPEVEAGDHSALITPITEVPGIFVSPSPANAIGEVDIDDLALENRSGSVTKGEGQDEQLGLGGGDDSTPTKVKSAMKAPDSEEKTKVGKDSPSKVAFKPRPTLRRGMGYSLNARRLPTPFIRGRINAEEEDEEGDDDAEPEGDEDEDEQLHDIDTDK